MNLKYKIRSGDYASDATRTFVCIYADVLKIAFISIENNVNLESNHLALHLFSTEDQYWIKELNDIFDNALDGKKTYGVKNGSTVLHDNKPMMLIGLFPLKIINSVMERPLLFDCESASLFTAKEMANSEFLYNYSSREYVSKFRRFFEYIFSSDEKTQMQVLDQYSKPLKIATPEVLQNLETITPSEASKYASQLFAMDSLDKIKNQKLKSKLKDLVVETIKIGIENNQIGITEKWIDGGFWTYYLSDNGNEIMFETFDIGGINYRQVITNSGEVGFLSRSINRVYTEPFFIQDILKNRTYYEAGVPYIEINDKNKPKVEPKPKKPDTPLPEPDFDDLINEGLDELSAEDLINQGFDELI